MADFSTIKGFNVQTLSADPPAPQEGEVWYNSTSGTLKGYGQIGTGAWAAGGTMSSYYGGAFSGTQTAGVYCGGVPGPTPTTSLYNGTSWTTNPTGLNQARHHVINSGSGTQTAAMVTGGETTPYAIIGNTEWFDGSTWSEKADLTVSRYTLVVGGNQAGAIGMTGYGPGVTAIVEEWDGSAWTAGTAAPQAKYYAMGGGSQTSAIVCGGSIPPQTNTSDQWNGTAWTEVANMNSGRQQGSSAVPSGTSALIFGGEEPPRTGKTELWDGTTWTEVADLGTANNQVSGKGTTFVAISAGGESPNNGATFEWNVPSTTKTFTAS